jgi:hypothetical protein
MCLLVCTYLVGISVGGKRDNGGGEVDSVDVLDDVVTGENPELARLVHYLMLAGLRCA